MHVQNIYSTCYLFSESCLRAFAVHFADCSGVISIISLQNLVTLEEGEKTVLGETWWKPSPSKWIQVEPDGPSK